MSLTPLLPSGDGCAKPTGISAACCGVSSKFAFRFGRLANASLRLIIAERMSSIPIRSASALIVGATAGMGLVLFNTSTKFGRFIWAWGTSGLNGCGCGTGIIVGVGLNCWGIPNGVANWANTRAVGC